MNHPVLVKSASGAGRLTTVIASPFAATDDAPTVRRRDPFMPQGNIFSPAKVVLQASIVTQASIITKSSIAAFHRSFLAFRRIPWAFLVSNHRKGSEVTYLACDSGFGLSLLIASLLAT